MHRLFLLLLFIVLSGILPLNGAMEYFVYSASNEDGIYLSRFDEEASTLTEPQHLAGTPKSFFLALHPTRPLLYSVEIGAGKVHAFSIGQDGQLKLINTVDSHGKAPCHPAVSPEGHLLVVANYNGGVVAYRLRPDGGLEDGNPANADANTGSGQPAAVYQPTGSSIDPKRQTGPHPHGVAFSRVEGKLVAHIADLGTDRVLALEIVEEPTIALRLLADRHAPITPGAGPRHVALHRSGRAAVVVNELDNTVSAFRIDPATSRWHASGTLSTLPEGHTGTTHTAEIEFHPSADLCYATNRGEESLAVFSVAPETGALAFVCRVAPSGQSPQHIAFTPTGKSLFVVNTNSKSISILPVDPTLGLPTGAAALRYTLPAPMCVLPYRPDRADK